MKAVATSGLAHRVRWIFALVLVLVAGQAQSAEDIRGTSWRGVWKYRGETGEIRLAIPKAGTQGEYVIVFASAPPIPGLREGQFSMSTRQGTADSDSASFGGTIGAQAGAPDILVDVKKENALVMRGRAGITTNASYTVDLELQPQ